MNSSSSLSFHTQIIIMVIIIIIIMFLVLYIFHCDEMRFTNPIITIK